MQREIVTVTPQGQVLIPENVRDSLSIQAGDKMAMYQKDNIIVLKRLAILSEEEIQRGFEKASEWAEAVGLKQEDVPALIKKIRAEYRAEKRANENRS